MHSDTLDTMVTATFGDGEPSAGGEGVGYGKLRRLFQSDAYRRAPAAEKRKALWQAVLDSRYAALPAIRYSYIWTLVRSLYLVLLRRPFSVDFDVRAPRNKMFHPRGSVGQMRFVAEGDHPYTGVYRSGALGLARLSLAMDPGRYLPGGAFKFLIDGEPSKNLLTVPSMDPVHDHNYFGHVLTTTLKTPRHLPFAVGWFVIHRWMAMYSDPLIEPLIDIARTTSDGRAVAEPRAPSQLFLRPPEELGFDPKSDQDVREELAERIEPGTLIYRVYGIDRPGSTDEVYIGHIVTESPFVPSLFGDRVLCFHHMREPASKYDTRLLLFVLVIVALVALGIFLATGRF
jgi:hypothetical protein